MSWLKVTVVYGLIGVQVIFTMGLMWVSIDDGIFPAATVDGLDNHNDPHWSSPLFALNGVPPEATTDVGSQVVPPPPQYGKVDYVIVPGAWRLPNGTLSKAFRLRVEHGARVALMFGARYLIFSGGLNDSHVAAEHLLSMTDAAERLFPLSWVNNLTSSFGDGVWADSALAIRNALRLHNGQALGEIIKDGRRRRRAVSESKEQHGEDLPLVSLQWPEILRENRSFTTIQNAVECRRLIEAQPDESPLAAKNVIVVTSSFHARRCKMMFEKVFSASLTSSSTSIKDVEDVEYISMEQPPRCEETVHRRYRVFVAGTEEDFFEWVLPKSRIQWIDTVPPKLQDLPFLPHHIGALCNTIFHAYASWRCNIRITMLSMEWYSRLREVAAIGKALLLRTLSISDVVRCLLTS